MLTRPNADSLTTDSLTTRLAGFALGDAPAAAPGGAATIVKLSLLDWLAVARAGANEPVARILKAQVVEEGGRGEAAVFGMDGSFPARASALANGTISHALDYDDTHFAHVGHPSVAVLPAVFALGDRLGARGDQIFAAALAGLEAACRVGVWLGRAHYQAGFHQTATSGCFGAAAASARLLGLNEDQFGHAFGIASTRGSGLKSQFGTMGKPFNAGMAAANGVEAALLAAKGFVSNPEGLEVPQGFGPTHAGEARKLDEVLEGLGTAYFFETVEHKFHACCHGLHAALEALGTARVKGRLDAVQVENLTIHTNPRWLKVCNINAPATGLEAKFSYRLTAAMALTGKDTSALTTFSDGICLDPELTALRDRIDVKADGAISDTGVRIEVLMKSGARLMLTHDLADPVPLEVRTRKVRAKAAGLLGPAEADRLWHLISAMPKSPDPMPLAALKGGGPENL